MRAAFTLFWVKCKKRGFVNEVKGDADSKYNPDFEHSKQVLGEDPGIKKHKYFEKNSHVNRKGWRKTFRNFENSCVV